MACGAILALRRFDQIRLPQFWAEDGAVFFLQARTLGAAAFLVPSAGYYHTALRVIAWLATKLDVSLAPAAYVGAAGALTLYVAACTQSRRFPLAPSPWYALAIVLMPDGYEVLLNLTNVQWILGCGLLIIVMLREPETNGQKLHDFIGVLLIGLTGPFVVIFLPLFVWRALQRRSAFSYALACLAGAGALVQITAILGSHGAGETVKKAAELFLAVTGARVGGALFTGGLLDAATPWLAGAIVGAVLLIMIAWLALQRGPARAERVYLGHAFAGLLGAALFRCRDILPHLLDAGLGGRYFYPVQLIAVWLLLANAAAEKTWHRWSVTCLLLVALVSNLPRLREPALADLNWQLYAARIRDGEQVVVPVNPVDWEFTVEGKPRAAAPVHTARSAVGLVNVSTRTLVTPDQPAAVGFVIRGEKPRRMLLRAVGPSLAGFNVAKPLAEPILTLQREGKDVAEFVPLRNDVEHPDIRDASDRCGAFALTPGSRDVVAVVDLREGSYTVTVSSDGNSGEVLIEVYEVPDRWYPTKSWRRAKDT